MGRPFLGPALGLALGILIGKFGPFLPPKFLFLGILILLPWLWVARGKKLFFAVFFLLITLLGILRIGQAFRLPPNDISHFSGGEWVSLEGRVAALPEMKEKGRKRICSFVLESENLVRRREFFEIAGKTQIFLFNPPEIPSYGSRVRLRGKLSLAKAPKNPGEFDYRAYLAEQGIRAVMEVYGGSVKIVEPPRAGRFSPLVSLQKIREFCVRRFERLFPAPFSHLLKALVLGLRKNLPEEFRNEFAKTGTAHLLAISGMNITLVAGSLFFLALCLGLPQKAAAAAGLFSTVGYVFISGAGIPVVRAGWMAGLFFTGLLIERKKDWLNSLFFAFFAILVFDPNALFQVGFQLSFLCVFFLLIFMRSPFERFGDWLQTFVVIVGTFPLGIAYFNLFSWTSFLANLLAIPCFHLAVLAGFASLLAGEIAWAGPFLIGMTEFFLKSGLAWIHFWAGQKWGYLYLETPPLRLFIFYYAALFFFWAVHWFEKLRRPLIRILSLSAGLLAAGLFFWPSRGGPFNLNVLAVGQNELVHVEFPGARHWVINTGRALPSDQARWTLAPYLRKKGIKHLEGVFLTDFSTRHTGGLPVLSENFSIRHLLFPAAASLSRELKKLPHTRLISLASNDRVPLGEGAEFRVVDVVKGKIFLLIFYQGRKFLFLPSGDSLSLERILDHWEGPSSVDVLIFPAYGMPSETVWQKTLYKLMPQFVIFTQKKSAFEFLPNSLNREEIPFLFLSETGALRFEIRGDKLRLSPYLPAASIDSF